MALTNIIRSLFDALIVGYTLKIRELPANVLGLTSKRIQSFYPDIVGVIFDWNRLGTDIANNGSAVLCNCTIFVVYSCTTVTRRVFKCFRGSVVLCLTCLRLTYVEK